MLLEANGPIDLAHTLGSGQAFRWRRDGDTYRGVVDGVVFRVRQARGGIIFDSAPRPPEQTAPLLRSYLRLDDDLRAIYRRMRRDARLAKTIKAYPGLRLVRQAPWECLVTFVVSIYSNIPRITRNIEDICRRYGDPISVPGDNEFTFPSPAILAKAGEAPFRDLGLGFRAKFIPRTAHAVLTRQLNLMKLRQASYLEAKTALLGLAGVGEKVADCVLAFSLDKPEAFPVDVHIRRAVLGWYFPNDKKTDREIRLWAADYFGRDAAYAQQYLFHERRLSSHTSSL